jgi:hypothetical protein
MKKSNYITQLAILLVGLVLTGTAFADIKIKTRHTSSGQTYESTTYIKGKRQRAEQNVGGNQTINITQCDLRRNVQIMPQAQTFLIDAWQMAQNDAPTNVNGTTKTQSTVAEKGGTVTYTYTTKDTGERKQMFGYTARHLIITMEGKSSPDACTQVNTKMVTDGWYIDAAFALSCDMDRYKNYNPYNNENPGCRDRYETKQIGTAKQGYPVYQKMTMFDQSGKETYSFINEVVELSNTTLEAALFDVPQGYREVKNSSELYASMSSQNSNSSSYNTSNNGDSAGNVSGLNSSVKNMASKPQNNSVELGAKKEGVVRIGLASVKTGSVGEAMNAAELAGAIQNTLSQYLKTPQVELVQLEAKLPSAIDQEAKSKECDYVIYANVSHKKGGGGFGFGKALGSIAGSAISTVGYGSTAGAIASHTASTVIYTAASAAGRVKAKDELTLDIKVNTTGGATTLAKQYKAKAKSDGEDIISPIIEQAAQAIIDAVAKK